MLTLLISNEMKREIEELEQLLSGTNQVEMVYLYF